MIRRNIRLLAGICRSEQINDAEIEEELGFHLEMLVGDRLKAGMSRADAEQEALRRFGDYQAIKRRCRRALQSDGDAFLVAVVRIFAVALGLVGLTLGIAASSGGPRALGIWISIVAGLALVRLSISLARHRRRL